MEDTCGRECGRNMFWEWIGARGCHGALKGNGTDIVLQPLEENEEEQLDLLTDEDTTE